MNIQNTGTRLPRRKVLQWFAAAAAVDLSAFPGLAQSPANTNGYGTDPNLAATYAPGDFWDLTLTEAEHKTATALADIILPADDLGPAASELQLVDFIDEWVSAPYPHQKNDRKIIIPGLKWIDEESKARFGKDFSDLTGEQQTAICDDLCAEKPKTPALAKGANFFHRFSGICMGGYYSTPQGWAAIGYVGNTPSGVFNGPPQAILDQLGLEQTVKD
ncbi:gluconate 2-dehydrogenase subunit 3 family protein [Verrucomicrobiales bacterium BCK34]|nr:gluconate 2-dehydrogenase subunit 3 family protein [Verrucomicrobiales bacterium BCK34]